MDFPDNKSSVLGGLIPIFLHWSEKEWPLTFLKVMNGLPICDTMGFPNRKYYGYSLLEKLRYSEEKRMTAKGELYSYSLTGLVKNRADLQVVLKYMGSRRHYFVCADRQDKARLFGMPGNLAKFEWSFDSQEKGDEDALVRYVITWQSREPAPFVDIALCSLTVPVSPLEDYVEDGYWQSGYTELKPKNP
jgi:hypothetical protein